MAKVKNWQVKDEYVGKVQLEDGAGNKTVLSNELPQEVLEKLAQNDQYRFFLEKKTVSDEQPKEN